MSAAGQCGQGERGKTHDKGKMPVRNVATDRDGKMWPWTARENTGQRNDIQQQGSVGYYPDIEALLTPI